MTTSVESTTATAADGTETVHVYRVYIKATPQAIWDAITQPDWTERYGYGGRVEFDLRPGGAFRSIANKDMQAAGMPEVIVDGEVIECDPPRRLVQTWRAGWDSEPPTRLTYEIVEARAGVCSLTVRHDTTGAPRLTTMITGGDEDRGAGGGWAESLSDLKTLLETGHSMFSWDLAGS
jgi:uncharacterized protein YndB with AHSA1/START domain